MTVDRTVVLVSLTVFIIFAALAATMAIETWLLANKKHPLTDWTRLGIHNFPVISFAIGILIAAVMGWLFGHFTCL